MPTKITMPQLGESVAEGTVGRWLKQEGESVAQDESLVEIITDKVTAELPSPVSGKLVKILVTEDQTVKVGTPIAEIEETGAAATIGVAETATTGYAATTPASTTASGTVASSQAATATSTAAPPATYGQSTNGNGHRNGANGVRERVSPLARRLAEEHQVDLHAIHGTGEGGRVRKEDILQHIAQHPGDQAAATPAPQAAPAPTFTPYATPAAPAAPSALPVSAGADDQIITPSPVRRMIAEHMVRSKHTAPHATTLVEVDMTGIARWLDHNREDFKRREGYGVSYQAFVIKATVEALKEFPYLNASWTEDNKIILRKQIHIGISIALANGLIVPVIRNADTLNIAGLARNINDLVTRARTNRLQPHEVQGATFTVNNPGVYGTIISVAVINQPNAGILTMDAVVKRAVVVDDAIAIRSMMFLGLSFDHRVVDGGTAAPFLASIKRRLEGMGPEIEVY